MLEAGQVIAGRYLLESLIGEGAMGAVFRAEDQTLRRQVAIKFLFLKGARDPQAIVDQFLREARIAASVQHRNVIHTVDFGTVESYQPFMVMELLSGESLGERQEREPKLSADQIVHILSLTLRGLAAVHDAGIVHRDLKPQNIFLQRDADTVYPKILDFGISRSVEHKGERASAIETQDGLIIGTPDYMSPEQARGEPDVDRRSDLYSVGVMLYEALTGRLPFESDTVGELIVQIVTKEPPSAREIDPRIPAPLSDFLKQAMAKRRDQRFSDARVMRRALLAAAEHGLPGGTQRIAASLGPAPSRAAPSAPGTPPGRASPPASSGATWGDFEGLDAPRVVDRSLPPGPPTQIDAGADFLPTPARATDATAATVAAVRVTPPPPTPAVRRSAGDRVSLERGAAERASRSGEKSTQRNGGRRNDPSTAAPLDAALDPLYAGADQAAPDIDYGRAGVQPAARRAPRATPAPRPRAPLPPVKSRKFYKPSIGPWLLPIAALVLLGYALSKPSAGSLPVASGTPSSEPALPSSGFSGSTLDPTVKTIRLQVKGRRANPGKAPPHMRDVVF